MKGFFGPIFKPTFAPLFGYTSEAVGAIETITKYVRFSKFKDLNLTPSIILPIKHIGEAFKFKFVENDDNLWSAYSIRVYYWSPSNETNTPDGYIESSNISKLGSEMTVTIPKTIIDEASTQYSNWRFQVIDTNSGACWMPPMEVRAINRGSVY